MAAASLMLTRQSAADNLMIGTMLRAVGNANQSFDGDRNAAGLWRETRRERFFISVLFSGV